MYTTGYPLMRFIRLKKFTKKSAYFSQRANGDSLNILTDFIDCILKQIVNRPTLTHTIHSLRAVWFSVIALLMQSSSEGPTIQRRVGVWPGGSFKRKKGAAAFFLSFLLFVLKWNKYNFQTL
jgi:hypothetical protein